MGFQTLNRMARKSAEWAEIRAEIADQKIGA
jgi:hypothetical protein